MAAEVNDNNEGRVGLVIGDLETARAEADRTLDKLRNLRNNIAHTPAPEP